jgi:dihydroxyacetone kinase
LTLFVSLNVNDFYLKVKAGDGKVAIIAGGGAGHEPFAAGNNNIRHYSFHLIFKK